MKTLLALLFACGLAGGAARAQTPPAPGPVQAEAERFAAQVAALYREGKFEEALAPARRVLELRERAHGGGHLSVAYAHANVATLHIHLKRDAEAEPHLERALAAAEKLGEPGRQLAFEVSNQLAAIRHRAGDYKATETHLRRSLDLVAAMRGAEDPAAVPVLLNLTDLGYQRRRPEEAEAHLARAVELLLKQPLRKEPDPDTAERLRAYICLLTDEASGNELSKRLHEAIFRVAEPLEAARQEQRAKEREGGRLLPVRGTVLNGRILQKVAPVYPTKAKNEGVAGRVVVGISVDEAGKVTRAERVCGHTLLAAAGVEAVRRWRFSPTLLDGQPVKVTGVVTVNFILQ